MRNDLTYRQQRNLNLISEALLTGRIELAEQALEESAMLNEQFGFGGRRGPKLVIDTPMGPATIDPLDVPDSMKDTDAGDEPTDAGDEPKKKDRGGVLGDIARTPRRVVAKIIRGIDDIFGDNLSNKEERRTATAILIAALLKQLEVDVPTVPSVKKDDDDDGQNPV